MRKSGLASNLLELGNSGSTHRNSQHFDHRASNRTEGCWGKSSLLPGTLA